MAMYHIKNVREIKDGENVPYYTYLLKLNIENIQIKIYNAFEKKPVETLTLNK